MWKSTGPISCSASNKIPASPNATFGGKKWTTTPAKCTWANAQNACPSGYHLPSQSEFQALLNSVGTDDYLYNAGWTDGAYWSSTEDGSGRAYYLSVNSSSASVDINLNVLTSHALGVRCVSQ